MKWNWETPLNYLYSGRTFFKQKIKEKMNNNKYLQLVASDQATS